MNVYTARGTPATDKYCFVQSGQVLVQDNELLQSIRKQAANGAVPVHFRTQGNVNTVNLDFVNSSRSLSTF